jgi:transcriptional regulator with XRE-family HTH domain
MFSTNEMAERIDELARSRDMSRNKLLIECGVRSYVDNLMKGQYPKTDTVNKIADYLDCSVDYLLGRTDKPEVNR